MFARSGDSSHKVMRESQTLPRELRLANCAHHIRGNSDLIPAFHQLARRTAYLVEEPANKSVITVDIVC
jgi:hypothetical protein